MYMTLHATTNFHAYLVRAHKSILLLYLKLVSMTTKTSNRQLIYPKNVIFKAMYLLPAKAHLNNAYIFKINYI